MLFAALSVPGQRSTVASAATVGALHVWIRHMAGNYLQICNRTPIGGDLHSAALGCLTVGEGVQNMPEVKLKRVGDTVLEYCDMGVVSELARTMPHHSGAMRAP